MARVRNAEGEYESTAARPREPVDSSTMVEPTEETGEQREPGDGEPGSETVGIQIDLIEDAAIDASESQPAKETVELERVTTEGETEDSDSQPANESLIEPTIAQVQLVQLVN
ncbi:predicted protein [Arabidopsis lyrata subsp. lyrata]|uniref:Predicted protein n=1 Tax=Arabidopsis lyrata subsp. lyrata TaxID=81972 RepID=D7KR89_ARALL|nr:predicted protein [Arabidopsis lyrata subsp. lyrata]